MLGRIRDRLRALVTGSSDAVTGADGDDDSIRSSIPSRQYSGRHAESGGLARDEQEAAIQAVEERAAALEEAR